MCATLGILGYHLRLQLDAAALAALCFPPLLALGLTPTGDTLPMAELFFVLPAPLLLAPLFSREWENGTADLLLVRPTGRPALLLSRLCVGLALLLLAVVVGWVVLALRGGTLPLDLALAVTLPGALALGSGGLLVATATRVSAAGYLAPLSWWLLDWVTRGSITGRLYLFGGLGGGEKGWLLALAALALAATGGLLARRDS